MFRISKCVDNDPNEEFWRILKSELYCLKKFNSHDELEQVTINYIDYYNSHRYQKLLNCMILLEYREYLKIIAI